MIDEGYVRANRRWGRLKLLPWLLLDVCLAAALVVDLIYGGPDIAVFSYVCFWVFLQLQACVYLANLDRLFVRATRARPLPDDLAYLEEMLDGICLASGMPRPRLLLIEGVESNAFSVKVRGRSAIFITHGLLKRLDRDEQEGVLAHESAHLKNGDASALNIADILMLARLFPVSLSAFGASSVWRQAGLVLAFASLVLFFLYVEEIQYPAVSIPMFAGVFLLLAARGSGKYFWTSIPRAADARDKEYVADEVAAKWTMNPRALAMAIGKIQFLGYKQAWFYINGVTFVPTLRSQYDLSVDSSLKLYYRERRDLRRQPSAEERVAALERLGHFKI